MNNEEFLTDNCKKDKELFNSYIRGFITPAIFLLLLAVIYYTHHKSKQEVYNSFVKGDEIICKNFIVSKNLGYKFYENSDNRISDGKNTFIIYNCMSKTE